MRLGLRWSDPTVVAGLAQLAALELGEIEPTRLKRCERDACDLVFYDATRSGTRRWSAESPCGHRERRRQAVPATATLEAGPEPHETRAGQGQRPV